MAALKVLLLTILLVGQTILLWGAFVFIARVFHACMRKRIRRNIEFRNQIVAWDSIKSNPSAGVVWVNRSRKYFHGLRLWWIPLKQSEQDADLFVKWQKCGQLIDNQELDMATIIESGHRIEDYDEH